MIPLRTGVVRDIRIKVYTKVMHLPLGFFSEERKGDIIARKMCIRDRSYSGNIPKRVPYY